MGRGRVFSAYFQGPELRLMVARKFASRRCASMFTGASAERPGVFEEAHTGTLFLDEIGELSLRAQAKVLRTIQDGELRVRFAKREEPKL